MFNPNEATYANGIICKLAYPLGGRST